MNRVDIMTDLETLGTKSNSTVFQVSAISFDIKTGEMFDSFNKIIDIGKEHIISDGSTIQWWLKTNKELMSDLINSEVSESGEQVFKSFREWIINQSSEIKNIYLWGNGIKFDNVMIDSQMSKYGLQYPIFYRNDRDVRTMLELASIKSGISEKEIRASFNNEDELCHNALDDCKYQIRLLKGCYDLLMN